MSKIIRRGLWSLPLLILLALLLTYRQSLKDIYSPKFTIEAVKKTVRTTYVIDGDTIVIEGGRKVRYIGIDAPEMDEPLYGEAKGRNKELVGNREVRLQVCEDEPFDRYGRILAWVYVDDTMVNLQLLKEGLAKTLIIPPCGVKKEAIFREFEKEARKKGLGIWALTEDIIDHSNAHLYIGKEKKVKGRVVSTYNSGKAIFLNFGEDYKKDFTVVIFSKDIKGFSDAGIELKDYFVGREIVVSGRIEEFNGPEIVVRRPSQIELLE